ncbi:hypothetical protein KIL84_000055 [Mauremys mutica]|uniref:Uncharacterized protein n=1 Tax=Mauremys mutica TaxID=74926 RepID=A0A9D4B310_9SAUR|nr:hypothetical protein KIL84_000055 [Mauremys mutica]
MGMNQISPPAPLSGELGPIPPAVFDLSLPPCSPPRLLCGHHNDCCGLMTASQAEDGVGAAGRERRSLPPCTWPQLCGIREDEDRIQPAKTQLSQSVVSCSLNKPVLPPQSDCSP